MDDDTKLIDESQIATLSGEGVFTCLECDNEVTAMVISDEGESVEADLTEIGEMLEANPKALITSSCPVCGMEYKFKIVDEDLVLQISDDEK